MGGVDGARAQVPVHAGFKLRAVPGAEPVQSRDTGTRRCPIRVGAAAPPALCGSGAGGPGRARVRVQPGSESLGLTATVGAQSSPRNEDGGPRAVNHPIPSPPSTIRVPGRRNGTSTRITGIRADGLLGPRPPEPATRRRRLPGPCSDTGSLSEPWRPGSMPVKGAARPGPCSCPGLCPGRSLLGDVCLGRAPTRAKGV